MRLSTIRHLYGGNAGPWASVYLDATATQVTGTPQEARRELDLRWRAARARLLEAGADEPTLRAIDDAVRRAPAKGGPAEVAVFASHGTVALTRTLPVRPVREVASWSAQPHAADLVRALETPDGAEVPWVLLDVDRAGATVTASDGFSRTVRGEDRFISKVASGGRDRYWSAARDQRAVEQNWEQNSAEVARVLTGAVERSGAEVVVLSGDVRARQIVLDRLPRALPARVVQANHEVPVRPHPDARVHARREPDVYDPVLAAVTREAINTVVAGRRAEVAERFHSGLSTGDSVLGLDAVSEAARELRIDALVLSSEPSQAVAWVDPANPTMVGPTKDGTATSDPVLEPADDALVGAAAIGDAEAVVIDPDPDLIDGLGAILRYQGATEHHYRRSGSHERRTGGPIIR